VDIAYIPKLVHELSKILGLRITRKHGVVYHGQSVLAEVKKFTSLGSTVLELNNSMTMCFVRPKINIVVPGKTKKSVNPQVYSLLFGCSIQESTCGRQKKTNIVYG
jgi:hypothetical protein